MALLICAECGHPADEHHEGGCLEALAWDVDEDGGVGICDCPRSIKELYDAAVGIGRIPSPSRREPPHA